MPPKSPTGLRGPPLDARYLARWGDSDPLRRTAPRRSEDLRGIWMKEESVGVPRHTYPRQFVRSTWLRVAPLSEMVATSSNKPQRERKRRA
jgi:hypothetical protein